MFWTGLIAAVLMAGTIPQAQAQAQAPGRAAPSAPPPSTGSPDRNRPLVCENRAVTGSRLNQRRCRTHAQVAADRAQAQDLTGEVLSGNATRPELVLNGGPI